ncbi:MAG: hypothetical protein MZV70_36470 [Desulfobacterales bacterium]|nr:hypothetical protein [Desulfobacterales bacterium]
MRHEERATRRDIVCLNAAPIALHGAGHASQPARGDGEGGGDHRLRQGRSGELHGMGRASRIKDRRSQALEQLQTLVEMA